MFLGYLVAVLSEPSSPPSIFLPSFAFVGLHPAYRLVVPLPADRRMLDAVNAYGSAYSNLP